jgi:hypothetical protein
MTCGELKTVFRRIHEAKDITRRNFAETQFEILTKRAVLLLADAVETLAKEQERTPPQP